MSHFLAKASLAALIALGSISFAGSAASAAPQTDFVVKAQYHRPPVRGCSPMEAIRKARYSGLRDVRISNITPRRVVVAGRYHRGWDRMTFANVRGCPVMRR